MNGLYDGISVLDNVIVTPNPKSHFCVQHHRGETASVIERNGNKLVLVFDRGERVLASRNEVAR